MNFPRINFPRQLKLNTAAAVAVLAAVWSIGFSPVLAQKSSASSKSTKSPSSSNSSSKSSPKPSMSTTKPAVAKPPYHPKYVVVVTQGAKSLGAITLEMLPELAPKHVANFDSLVRTGFYNGTAFHRVMPGFMIQGGDPNSKSQPKATWGMGDPSQKRVPAEFNSTSHTRGIVSAARTSDPNSATSQFFICHGDATPLDGQYSVFGRVVSGLEVVDAIANVPCEVSAGGEKSAPVEKVEMSIYPKSQYIIAVKHDGKPLGDILIETLPEVAPKHAMNFDSLVAAQFYDGTAFHRVIGGFVIQGGDPASKANSGKPKAQWGTGMPGQTTVPLEVSSLRHTRGMISAARTNDPNSATSQFFICHGDPSSLDGQYSIWGQVLAGMEVVDAIVAVPLETGGDGAASSPVKKVEMTIRKR